MTNEEMQAQIVARSVPEPNSGCWLWIFGGFDRKGYGLMRGGGARWRAHRASYEAFVGPIPEGLFVLHACDTPACVNPDHLSTGDNTENMRQMYERGRGSASRCRGSSRPKSCTTEAAVSEWRSLYLAGESTATIATKYGMRPKTVRRAIAGETWGHVPGAVRLTRRAA